MAISTPVIEAVVETTNGGSIRAGVWTGVVVAGLALLTTIARQWGPWKTIARDERLAEHDRHEARIKILEERLDQQAAAHTQALLTKDAQAAAKEAQHDAEISAMRHRMNNLDQCLTMILMLIEQDPEKAQQAATKVREVRERQEATERAERAAISAARITASVAPNGHDKGITP